MASGVRGVGESGVRRWLPEPIVHFTVIGGLAFGARAAFERAEEPEAIAVSRATRDHLARELHASLGRAPNAAESALALERWKIDEAAYREGERLGYLRDDEAVRARLVARAREVYRGLEQARAPGDAELEAFLNENRARYELPERFEFEHAFAARDKGDAAARVKAFVREAENGEALGTLGDEFSAGNRLDAAFEEVARVFGFGFATALEKASPGGLMLLEGTRGMHAVRLQRRIAAALPPEGELRPRLLRDYFREQESALGERALRRIAGAYRFAETGP